MNYVYIRTLLSSLLQRFSILFQSLQNQILVYFFFKPIGKQGNLFVVNEGLDEIVGFFPLLLISGLQNNSLLWVRYEYLVFKLTFLHCFEERHVADSCRQWTNVQLFLILHRISSIHTTIKYNPTNYLFYAQLQQTEQTDHSYSQQRTQFEIGYSCSYNQAQHCWSLL